MKKLVALWLAAAMAFCLCACGNAPAEPEEEAGVKNPITEYASLSEINEVVGSKLEHPGVMGVTEETYAVIDAGDYKIAQYCFSLNGVSYTYRACPVLDNDISGAYTGEDTIFDGGYSEEITYADWENMLFSRWCTSDGQYVLSATGDITPETFRAATEELCALSAPEGDDRKDVHYEMLAGGYADKTSQRATMTVEALTDAVAVTVSWSSSAFETTEWQMTGTLSEDGLLRYTDGTKTTYTFTEESEEPETEVAYTDGEGYFEIDGDTLLWTGAEDEACRECVFEKLPEMTE